MVVGNTDLEGRIENIIEHHYPKNLSNCGYTLRLGTVIEPGTGNEITLENKDGKTQLTYTIKPAEILIIQTKERVKMPLDLTGSFSALHRWARKGLLLINSSIVEPGYHGNLSCFVINFSKREIVFKPNDDIAKIVLHKLSDHPDENEKNKALFSITEEEYKNSLSEQARAFQDTFLDIHSIEERAGEIAVSKAKSAITYGGIILAFLLTFSTLSNFVSKWISFDDKERKIIQLHEQKLDSMRMEIKQLKNILNQQENNISESTNK
ncbi:MAG: hypothetical protein AAFY45_33520 [Bacteroidota bacterium]